MRVAVTGGSGFIGTHVVDALAAAGHEVAVLDTAPRDNPNASATFEVDVRDQRAIAQAIEGCEVVFHLAGVSNVNVAREHPIDTVRINIEGTARVCDAARSTGARVVLASTVWVYGAAVGPQERPLDESATFDLTALDHIYTSSKLSAEAVMQSYRKLFDVPITILRYGIPYGPGMRDELVLARFVAQAYRGENITIAGTGEQTRNYVYVGDLAAAHVAALDEAAIGQTFALEGREAISVRQMAETVLRLTESSSHIEWVPARAGDYAGREVSAEHVAQVLNWRPTTGFEQGVQNYLDWLASEPTRKPTPAA